MIRVAGSKRLRGATLHDGNLVTREIILRQQIAHFHVHEIEQLGVINHVALVQKHDNRRNTHLTGEQDVLTRLRHRPVGRGNHENRAIHLRGTGDHVFDVVGVAGAIHVRIVALFRLILDVGGIDRDAALLFLGSGINVRVALGFSEALLGENGGDCRSERGLAVIDVADRADVHMGFVAFELSLGHKSGVVLVGLVVVGLLQNVGWLSLRPGSNR